MSAKIIGRVGGVEVLQHEETGETFMGYRVGPMVEFRPARPPWWRPLARLRWTRRRRQEAQRPNYRIKSIEAGEIVLDGEEGAVR